MTSGSLPDRVVDRLRESLDEPDVSGMRYSLEARIGRGGLGTVYAAFDRVLQRRVALKVLTAIDDPDRLLAEARTAARLEHPGIVPVHDAGRLGDGRAYYTMRLVDGKHLDEYARHTATLAQRLRVFQTLCDAMAYAHSRGVVHCDLKPSNVMVGSFGEVFVMDWGVGVAGTRRYRAPEQSAGAGASVTTQADVHAPASSFGVSCLPAHRDPSRPSWTEPRRPTRRRDTPTPLCSIAKSHAISTRAPSTRIGNPASNARPGSTAATSPSWSSFWSTPWSGWRCFFGADRTEITAHAE